MSSETFQLQLSTRQYSIFAFDLSLALRPFKLMTHRRALSTTPSPSLKCVSDPLHDTGPWSYAYTRCCGLVNVHVGSRSPVLFPVLSFPLHSTVLHSPSSGDVSCQSATFRHRETRKPCHFGRVTTTNASTPAASIQASICGGYPCY
jgi:hypothetical protein